MGRLVHSPEQVDRQTGSRHGLREVRDNRSGSHPRATEVTWGEWPMSTAIARWHDERLPSRLARPSPHDRTFVVTQALGAHTERAQKIPGFIGRG